MKTRSAAVVKQYIPVGHRCKSIAHILTCNPRRIEFGRKHNCTYCAYRAGYNSNNIIIVYVSYSHASSFVCCIIPRVLPRIHETAHHHTVYR